MKKSVQQETAGRSLAKTITYRIAIIVSTFVVSLWVTGDTTISLGITSISAITNTIIYYFHERVWCGVKWGRVR